MQRLDGINLSCGTCYSSIFNPEYWYSNLDHSLGAALIVWHFTKDKTQTLAALFHDIASPVFKHCIDFMNGDSEKQESTEERTAQIIQDSQEIVALLKRDGIPIEKVVNYHDYPIADNDSPKLSADRLEYTFSSGLSFFRVWELSDIQYLYGDLTIFSNEDGVDELGFKTPEAGVKFVERAIKLWPEFVSDPDRTVMQFLADIVKSAIVRGYLTVDELYTLSETEVIHKLQYETDDYLSLSFSNFSQAGEVYCSDVAISGKYCTSVKAKRRYINPLILNGSKLCRVREYSTDIDKSLGQFLDSDWTKYTGFDFEFTPYSE